MRPTDGGQGRARDHVRCVLVLAAVTLAGCGQSADVADGAPTDDEVVAPTDEEAAGTDDARTDGRDDDGHDDGQAGPDGDDGAPEGCPRPEGGTDEQTDATDGANQEDDVAAEAPPSRCEPGPDEPTDELVVDDLTLTRREGNEPLHATFSVTNTTDTTRRFILPTVVPRAEQDGEEVRLSYLRIAFVHDDDGRSNPRVDTARPGHPQTISVAAGDTVEVDQPILARSSQVADRMRLCFEVLPPSPDGSPNASAPTGEEAYLPTFDVGFGPDQPVPLICSDTVVVGEG